MRLTDEILRRNSLKKTVDFAKASEIMHSVASRVTAAATHAANAEDARASEDAMLLEDATNAAEALLEATLLAHLALAQLGLDAETAVRLALQAEAEGRKLKVEDLVRSVMSIHLGPAYHARIGLTTPRDS